MTALSPDSLVLAWPAALAVLILLPLARWFQFRRAEHGNAQGAIVLPFAGTLPGLDSLARAGLRRSVPARSVLVTVVFILLAIAAARPQWIEAVDLRPASGRDLMVLLDVSASMKTRDLAAPAGPVSRLQAGQRFGRAFVARRPGDRVGLTVFASRPYAYVPLTYDMKAVGDAIDAVQVGLAGQETALGDAVAAGIRALTGAPGEPLSTRPGPEGSALVLVSDGANTAGSVSVMQAAWLAEQRRVRIYALGIGGSGGFADLEALAKQSGGIMASATDLRGVADFFDKVDAIEAAQRRPPAPAVRAHELYPWPLALALLLLMALDLSRRAGGRTGGA